MSDPNNIDNLDDFTRKEIQGEQGYSMSSAQVRDGVIYQVKPVALNDSIEIPKEEGEEQDKALQQREANIVEPIKEYLNYAHILSPNSTPEIAIAANANNVAITSKYLDGFEPVRSLGQDPKEATKMKGFGEMLAVAAATGDSDINIDNVGTIGDRIVKIDGGQALSNFYTSPDSLKSSLDRSLKKYYNSSFDEVMKNEDVKKEFYDKLTEISKVPQSEITAHMDRRAAIFHKAAEGKNLPIDEVSFGYRIDGESAGFGADDVHDVKEFLKDGARLNHTVITQVVDEHNGKEQAVTKDAIFEATIQAVRLEAEGSVIGPLEEKFKHAANAVISPKESLELSVYKHLTNNLSHDELLEVYKKAVEYHGDKSEATLAVQETMTQYIKNNPNDEHVKKGLGNTQRRETKRRSVAVTNSNKIATPNHIPSKSSEIRDRTH